MSIADAIREILTEEVQTSRDPDWNGIEPDSIESAVKRLVALYSDRYEWGIRKTWKPEYGGHTIDQECSSEREARDSVAKWTWTLRQQHKRTYDSSRLASFQVIRRAVGPWEVVES